MPIVSAVIYTRPEDTDNVAFRLGADSRLTVSPPCHDRFALVADTRTRAEDKALWRAVQDLENVLRIEVVMAHFEDLHQEVS